LAPLELRLHAFSNWASFFFERNSPTHFLHSAKSKWPTVNDMTAQDRTQTKLVVFAVLFSVVLFVLVAILVVAIVFCTRKSGRIAQRIGIVRTEDSIKLGSTLAADDAIDEFLQAKQKTPYPVILSMTTSPARL